MGFFKTIAGFAAIMIFYNTAKAQLSFPDGSVLNLNTSNDFLYIETRILFNTGIYRSDDYQWEKISDSLDNRWLIGACFNGDCRNDLVQSGNFRKVFGLNDSTGFIAFHVETYEYNGTSIIKYKVYNNKDSLDKADLIFNISYTKPTGINEHFENFFSTYPNPAINELNVKLKSGNQSAEIQLVNTLGVIVLSKNMDNKATETLNVSELPKGIYFIKIKSDTRSFTQKFIKQ